MQKWIIEMETVKLVERSMVSHIHPASSPMEHGLEGKGMLRVPSGKSCKSSLGRGDEEVTVLAKREMKFWVSEVKVFDGW